MASINTILVTGFGPFENHQVNASWEAVKLLPSLFNNRINLITQEIPVDYKFVSNTVPQLWEKFKPQLVIHVGVSSICECFQIESVAHKKGYNRPDVNGVIVENHSCGDCDAINCTLNLERIISKLKDENVIAEISSNCGRYLCEYIYYQSLSINNSCSLFIHVPPINKPYSVEELSRGLKKIIEFVIEELQKEEK